MIVLHHEGFLVDESDSNTFQRYTFGDLINVAVISISDSLHVYQSDYGKLSYKPLYSIELVKYFDNIFSGQYLLTSNGSGKSKPHNYKLLNSDLEYLLYINDKFTPKYQNILLSEIRNLKLSKII